MVECQKHNDQKSKNNSQHTTQRNKDLKNTLERCSVSAPLVITVMAIGIPMMSQ